MTNTRKVITHLLWWIRYQARKRAWHHAHEPCPGCGAPNTIDHMDACRTVSE